MPVQHLAPHHRDDHAVVPDRHSEISSQVLAEGGSQDGQANNAAQLPNGQANNAAAQLRLHEDVEENKDDSHVAGGDDDDDDDGPDDDEAPTITNSRVVEHPPLGERPWSVVPDRAFYTAEGAMAKIDTTINSISDP